jgi:hypothetical protein
VPQKIESREGVMMNSHATIGRNGPSSDRGKADEELPLPAILAQLSRLLIDLHRQCDSPAPSLEVPNRTIAAWEDEEHVYIEARLPQALEAPIDLSAHDRTLFICIAR